MDELKGRRVTLVPTVDGHIAELLRIRDTPQVRARWGETPEAPDWPFDEPEVTPFTVFVGAEGGPIVGFIQYGEELTPAYRHASIDIFLDPALHGQGVGRDAIWTLAHHLIHERHHHRIVIDPATDNAAAIRCYASVGFRPVGVMRGYERDADGGGWHDGLLMDLLADELSAQP
ncbi:MAG TPA: GNAT family protein [Frankiaceae bacterium]|nr:GNAT family protein [Frankiaceae bacterium]